MPPRALCCAQPSGVIIITWLREELRGWFTGRLPADWFTAAPEIKVDREEITIVGTLADTEGAAGASEAEAAAAAEGRSRRFREETREHRIEIAREAEHKFGRKVSWGVEMQWPQGDVHHVLRAGHDQAAAV